MAVMQWQQRGDCWVVSSSPRPRAVLHFLGGAFVGSIPQIIYQGLLEQLARSGFGVITTSYTTDANHGRIAVRVAQATRQVQDQLNWQDLPVFGLGHSLGGKLQILSCILDPEWCRRRRGNIFFAYNNSSLKEALPWGNWDLGPLAELTQASGLRIFPEEFEPSPAQTNQWIQSQYSISPHLLIKFERDTIDEIQPLYTLLSQKFGDQVSYRLLAGDHGTGVSQSYPLSSMPSDSLGPLDVVGQFFYESLNRETLGLTRTIRSWLQQQLTLVKG